MFIRLFFLTCLFCFFQSKPVYSNSPSSSGELVDFEYLEPTDIIDITKDISKIFSKNIIFTKKISAKISIITQGKVSKALAYEIYVAALARLGFFLVETQYVSQIVSLKKSFSEVSVSDNNIEDFSYSDNILVYILRLKHLKAKDLMRYLTTILGAGNALELEEGTILLSGSHSVVKSLIDVSMLLDKETREAKSIKMIKLVNSSINEAYKHLTDLGILRQGASFQDGKIIKSPENNAFFVYGSEKFYEQVKSIVSKLDIKVTKNTGKQYYIKALEFTEAKKIASILSGLKSNKSSKSPFFDSGSGLFSGEYEITPEEYTNSLIIASTPRQYEELNRMIKKLDKLRAQILFEVDVLEVSDGFGFKFESSSFLSSGEMSDKVKVITGWEGEKVFPILTQDPSKKDKNSLSELNTKFGSVSDDLILGVLSTSKIKVGGMEGLSPGALIKLMKTDEFSRVVSSPFLMSVEGEEASLTIADTKAYTVTEKAQGASSSVGVSTTMVKSKIQKESSEVVLILTAHVDTSNNITLNLNFNVSSITGVSAEGLPSVGKRTVKQEILLKSGQTMFVSGFNTSSQVESFKKIPFLGDIPLLGALFRKHETSFVQGKLIVFVTPHVSWGKEDLDAIYQRKIEERFMDLKIIKKQSYL